MISFCFLKFSRQVSLRLQFDLLCERSYLLCERSFAQGSSSPLSKGVPGHGPLLTPRAGQLPLSTHRWREDAQAFLTGPKVTPQVEPDSQPHQDSFLQTHNAGTNTSELSNAAPEVETCVQGTWEIQTQGPLLQLCRRTDVGRVRPFASWLPCGLPKRRLPSTPRTPALPPLWHLGQSLRLLKKSPFSLNCWDPPEPVLK